MIWSRNVSLRTRPVWDQKKNGLGLASLVLCCETRSCHARRHNDLEVHSNISSTINSFSVLCLEHHYCGDQQWRSFIEKDKSAQVPLFTSGGLGLGLVILVLFLVLVLRIWSCLHNCHWSSSGPLFAHLVGITFTVTVGMILILFLIFWSLYRKKWFLFQITLRPVIFDFLLFEITFLLCGFNFDLNPFYLWSFPTPLFNHYLLTPPKLSFPIELLRRPYNSVRTTLRYCDSSKYTNDGKERME